MLISKKVLELKKEISKIEDNIDDIQSFQKEFGINNIIEYLHYNGRPSVFIDKTTDKLNFTNISGSIFKSYRNYLRFTKEYKSINIVYDLNSPCRLNCSKCRSKVYVPDYSKIKMTKKCHNDINKLIESTMNHFKYLNVPFLIHEGSYMSDWLETYLIFS